jgi:hypothetical protein
VTHHQLWGAIFLAAAAFQAWQAFSSASSGKWTFRLYRITVDHRTSPIGFWVCIAWSLFAMGLFLAVGAFELLRH